VVVLLLLFDSIKGKTVTVDATISSEFTVVVDEGVVVTVGGALPEFKDAVSMITSLSICAFSEVIAELALVVGGKEDVATSTD
jgi:hypothetical protein